MGQIKVLDSGFVRLEDKMGDDLSVVRAARVSYGKSTRTPEDDKKLIAYLIKNSHGTPLEHTSFTFHIKCPIFVMRQWIRHRIGQSFNEISGRYSVMTDEFYMPSAWRVPDKKNKQGSILSGPDPRMTAILLAQNQHAYSAYQDLLNHGVAKEMARMVLPLNLYTQFYWTCNARSLMAFLTLRAESHAQWETRQYAYALAKFLSILMPWTWEAFSNTLGAGYDEMREKWDHLETFSLVESKAT